MLNGSQHVAFSGSVCSWFNYYRRRRFCLYRLHMERYSTTLLHALAFSSLELPYAITCDQDLSTSARVYCKGKVKLLNHYAMKAMVKVTPPSLYSLGRTLDSHWIRGCVSRRARMNTAEKMDNPCPAGKRIPISRPSRSQSLHLVSLPSWKTSLLPFPLVRWSLTSPSMNSRMVEVALFWNSLTSPVLRWNNTFNQLLKFELGERDVCIHQIGG
jgi:hypothetical protein